MELKQLNETCSRKSFPSSFRSVSPWALAAERQSVWRWAIQPPASPSEWVLASLSRWRYRAKKTVEGKERTNQKIHLEAIALPLAEQQETAAA
jgi:hypothetical protein